ncbi:MAG: adenine phosphoribosyltransferase [Gemmatimonadota bacterium]
MSGTAQLAERLRSAIRDIPDFPKPGIIFKDITPILADADLFHDVVDYLARHFVNNDIHVIAGIESRGFIFGAPLAVMLRVPFVPIRKIGKLPARKVRMDYALEYGTDTLEAHADAMVEGQRVLIVDDVLATGGTAEASGRLVRSLGAEVAGYCIPIELAFLKGREKLGETPLHTLVSYQ